MARNMVSSEFAIRNDKARPVMPKIGPKNIIKIIIKTKTSSLLNNTKLLFLIPSSSEVKIAVNIKGIIEKLIIWKASIESKKFGKNCLITYDDDAEAKIAIIIEKIMDNFFNFLFGFPLASWGRIYLKIIPGTIINPFKICNANEYCPKIERPMIEGMITLSISFFRTPVKPNP